MEDRPVIRCWHLMVVSALMLQFATNVNAQNFERYRPQDLSNRPFSTPEIPVPEAPSSSEDDRTLVKNLDAVIIVGDKSQVSLDASIDDLEGYHPRLNATDSVVYQSAIRSIVARHLNQPISLRSINRLTSEIIKCYQKCGQPIIDVVVPEQRITGGTLQIVVVETRISQVLIKPGCIFECAELDRWISCTVPGDRVYEHKLQSDLFWLNQNPFRRVSVDFEKGADSGTTNVLFKSHDITPIRGYMGADDTGVRSLNYGRFFAGLMYGNMFQRGGMLSYQYTTDQQFQLLNAHSLSYSQPVNRDYSVFTYGSWAGVIPNVGVGLTQQGESWQFGASALRHLIRTPEHSQNLSFGFDFKSTNNNLEFAGSSVVASNAELFELHLGFDDLQRTDIDQYQLIKLDSYIGPGGGLTGANSSSAFQTIRPGTSPDYFYSRLMVEQTTLVTNSWQLLYRLTGQVASERLLFSETLGLGGYDTIRGFNQRAYNADTGWILNLEFGPRTFRGGCKDEPETLRLFSFIDMGTGYLKHARPGEDAYTYALSTGVGMRYNMSDRLSCRLDYGYALEGISGAQRENRLHFGVTWIPGERPR